MPSKRPSESLRASRERWRRRRDLASSPRRRLRRWRLRLSRRVDGTWRYLYAIAATHNTNPRESKLHDAQNDTVNTQVRLARPQEAEKGPGPRERPLRLRGERPQDRRFVSMEPGLAERLLSEHAERPVGAGAVLRKHDGV